MKLSDKTIAQIAKCVQLAILTGTDVVDHLRQLDLVETNGTIDIDPSYLKNFELNLSSIDFAPSCFVLHLAFGSGRKKHSGTK